MGAGQNLGVLSFLPLSFQHGEDKFAAPSAFEPKVIHEVRLAPEFQTLAESNCRAVEDIDGGKNSMRVESAEHVMKHALDGFIRIAMALVRGRERDADLHLARITLLAMKSTIADEIAGGGADDR